MERERVKSILESLLFVAVEPISARRIEEVLDGVERKEIASILDELRNEYESGGRGIRLAEVAGGYQLRTASENADWVKKLHQLKPQRLSRATLETLAIVAYRQPITRAEIEKIRGVDVGAVLATLVERRLVRVVARKDVPGKPFLYGTTPEFLETFSLKDLSQLPTLKEAEQFAQSPPPEATPPSSEEKAEG
ncbi:MAG TPA: SMC-Scp complex subunit ScpB [Candidatus Acidoferrales bacterium]|nr:SMC-Scp complex subunit ScpB [Candidatus Acidoferrales bacterium]